MFGTKRVRRKAAALAGSLSMIAAGATMLAASPASAEPAPPTTAAVTVSPSTGLNPAGATITVNGSGFSTTEPGIYVAIASTAKYDPADGEAFGTQKWVHVGATPSRGQDALNTDGTFSTTLDVKAVFGEDEYATDCTVEQCAIYTLAAHGSTDRTQDTTTPISFGTGGSTSTPPPSSSAPSPTPSTGTSPQVTVNPATDLDPTGQTITVTGTGFKAAGNGIYVGVAARTNYDPANADVFDGMKWVHVGASPSASQDVLAPDGSFTTTLTVRPQFGDGVLATDCLTTGCALYTLAAHGSTDRSQDTVTAISFRGAVETSPSESASPSETPGPTGQISLSTSQIAAGGQLTVTASGFDPNENVQAILHSDPIDLGISQADATGGFALTFTVPADLASGAHTVNLLGLASGRAVSAPLTVVDAGEIVEDAVVSTGLPLGGLDGAQLAATGTAPNRALLLGALLLAAGLGLCLTTAGGSLARAAARTLGRTGRYR